MTDTDVGADDEAGGQSFEIGATGLQHLLEHIQDAVVAFELVDSEPIVRDVNRAFVESFGYDRSTVVGTPLNDCIVPEWLRSEAAELDARTEAGEVNYRQVQRTTGDGLRTFLYRGIPFDDETASIDGFAMYTDLTEMNRTERQMQVLTRVLRHNLRTEATIIAGNAAQIREQTTPEDAELEGASATIEDRAQKLLSLTEEAAQLNDIISAADEEPIAVDLIPIVETVVDRTRDRFPTARFEVTLPDSLSVVATSRLRIAIENVVENAAEHNPADRPRVRISVVDTDDEWIDLLVEDDAPQIPPMERRVVTGDAEITPKRHGSGLGLWLLKWVIDACGGELFFEQSDLGGNCVRIRLRRGRAQ
ncbi:MAG: ATP-binding protein [Natronomonas sp.]